MSLTDASNYEKPFEYVRKHVKPKRDKNKRASYRERWWIHVEPRPKMRAALDSAPRFLATSTVAKFRLFSWLTALTLPDHQLIVFARDDDYFFGVLHSAVHERWSLRMGTALEDRPRYTPTTCFETFPFPALAGGIEKAAEPRSHRATKFRERIAEAAKKLYELREEWLNPTFRGNVPMLTADQLKKRTLTNLYNERPTWLEMAHLELDRVVLAAYGWPEDWTGKLQPQRDAKGKVNPILGVVDPTVEQEVLSRLLDLNLKCSANLGESEAAAP